MTQKKRKYENLWNEIKRTKRVSIVPTKSTEESIVQKFVYAATRGVQKEKYKDDAFRVRFPDSRILTEYAEETQTLTFILDLGVVIEDVSQLFGDGNE